jgi:hypothetical protein
MKKAGHDDVINRHLRWCGDQCQHEDCPITSCGTYKAELKRALSAVSHVIDQSLIGLQASVPALYISIVKRIVDPSAEKAQES